MCVTHQEKILSPTLLKKDKARKPNAQWGGRTGFPVSNLKLRKYCTKDPDRKQVTCSRPRVEMGTHDKACAMCGCSGLKSVLSNTEPLPWDTKVKNQIPKIETSKPCRPCHRHPTWRTPSLRPLLRLWANGLLIIFWKNTDGFTKHWLWLRHPPASFL